MCRVTKTGCINITCIQMMWDSILKYQASIHSTHEKLLTHMVKQGLQKYCETSYSRSGVNQMWILKNSKELLEHLQSPNFNHITSINSFDFSTLYTTIPHQKLKSRLATIIRNSFIHKKWKSQIQISGFRSRRTLFCQGTLRFKKQVHWRWHH